MDITPLFNLMVEKKASDMYLSVGAPIKLRIDGNVRPLSEEILEPKDVQELADSVMDEEQRAKFLREKECDLSFSLRGAGRFRVNVFRQRYSTALVIRSVSPRIRTLDELQLPEILKKLALLPRGLVLVVGGTGCGKSTTLAAMIDHRNGEQAGHILTIEDPVEFLHSHKRSIVNQREVGSDTKSYHSAIRSALRQAPDALLIGEIRDRESLEAALSFAETGHLVLSTLHANNASQTLERIMSLAPKEVHSMIQMQLSLNLQGVIAQRRVRRKGGEGRVVAMEIMLLTPRVQDLIRRGEIFSLPKAMEMGVHENMQAFDGHLYTLYKQGVIDYEEAVRAADSPTDLSLRIRSEEEQPAASDLHLAAEAPEPLEDQR